MALATTTSLGMSRHRYHTLTAWRGAACLAVLAFHSFGANYGKPVWPALAPLRALCRHGWTGLDLFFAISGYCIFERLARAREEDESVWAFWQDRAWRILPTYWAALALSIVLNVVTWPFNQTRWAANFPSGIPAGLSDLSLTQRWFGYPPFILVSWTLACEVVFYALAGLCLAVSRRSFRLLPAFLLGLGLCGLAGRASPTNWQLPFVLWPDFFAGACAYLAIRGAVGRDFVSLGLAVGGLAGLSLAAIKGWPAFNGEGQRAAIGFAWLLLLFFPADAWLARWAPVRCLAWVGTFSYSLYLIHVQVLTRVLGLGTRLISMRPTEPLFLSLWLSAVGAALMAGWAFWRLVERRAERWRRDRRALQASPVILAEKVA